MKVIREAKKNVFRVKCWNCRSELEAENSDVEWSESSEGIGTVTCPICGHLTQISYYKNRVVIYKD